MQQDAQIGREPVREGYHLMFPELSFDAENIALQGLYGDELSAYRARRGWNEALESSFLLDSDRDYHFTVTRVPERHLFILECRFLTACGRYAFWRLSNHQSPETEYLIETAHLPALEVGNYLSAPLPDLNPLISTQRRPAVEDHLSRQTVETNQTLWQRLGSVFRWSLGLIHGQCRRERQG